MTYSLRHIAHILNADFNSGTDQVVEHIVIDSRKVFYPESSVFFALRGERRNGHSFVGDLYYKGVRCFVISEHIPQHSFPEAVFLIVGDTLQALQRLTEWHRAQFHYPVIGITGSNGKTIVKEWLYQLLHESFSIVRSPKSYNSQVGVPLSVWEMNGHYQLAIFEAGISHTGEMKNLADIVRPVMGVLTNIGEAHSEGFLNNEEKLREKCLLFTGCKTIIANEIFRQRLGKYCPSAKVLTWGKDSGNSLAVAHTEKNERSTSFQVRYNGYDFSLTIPFTDEASMENALACTLVCLESGVDIPIIVERIKKLTPVNMRLELKKGINGCVLINDSYSADLSSLKIALNFLDQQAHGSSKTVILSDFPQSGKDDSDLYQQIFSSLQRHDVKRAIWIGPHISLAVASGMFRGETGIQLQLFNSTEEFLRSFHSGGFRNEAILVKGARAFGFEQIVQLLEQKVHETVLEINLNAVAHNLKTFQQKLKPSTRVMAMVKAFAYGSGGTEIARILQYHKVDYLGVAYADEGIDLRRSGITIPVMVMNTEESAFDAIIENSLEPVIFSFDILHSMVVYLERQGISQYPVHIEIETGMNRLGFSHSEIPELTNTLSRLTHIRIQSVFTHLAASEDKNEDAFTGDQAKLFMSATDAIEKVTGYTFLKHIANSAGASRHPNLQMDMVRLGIGLYGIDTTGDMPGLEAVASLKSTIAQVRKLTEGETVSYNRKGIITKNSIIGTVRIGYADGYPRRLGHGRGHVLVKGVKAPVVGTVCMDMFMIDLSAIPDASAGDEVLIFGKDLPVEEVALLAGTIPYEIMTGISQRVKRVYFEE